MSGVSNLELQRSLKQGSRYAGHGALRPHQNVARKDDPDESEANAVAHQRLHRPVSHAARIRRPGEGYPDPRLLGASAYAVQDNIVLAPEIALDSEEGAHILAHELVHVEQAQRSGDDTIRRYIDEDMVGTSIGADYAQSLSDEGLDAAVAAGHQALRTHPPDSIEYIVAEQNLQLIVAEIERRGYKSPELGRQALQALFPAVLGEMLEVIGLVRQVVSDYDVDPFAATHGPPAFMVAQLSWMNDALGAAHQMFELSYDAEPDLALSLIEQVGVRLSAVIIGCHTIRAYLPFPAYADALVDDDPMRNPMLIGKYLRWARERVEPIFSDLAHLDWEGVDTAAEELPNVLYNLSNDLEAFEEAFQPRLNLPPAVQAGLVVLSVILTRRSIRAGGGPKAPPRLGPGTATALGGGSGAGVAVMGSVSVTAAQLEAIRRLVSIGALSIAATAAAASGFEPFYRIDESLPSELKDVLGHGPEVDAMRVTGKSGAGMARNPRHHVMPQEHRKWFKDRGIDIDDFAVRLSKAEHEAIHGGGNWRLGRTWPNEWNQNIMRKLTEREAAIGRQLTRPEILKIVINEMRAYAIPIKFIRFR